MENTLGFLTIELMNGVNIEYINSEAWNMKNAIYGKWLNDFDVEINSRIYKSTEIYEMHYSFTITN